MTCKMAVWLDHKRALVVSICERKVTTDTVEFEEPPASRPGGGLRAPAVGAVHGVDPDQKRDARHALHLQRYYERIVELLARADAVHLMGPGQAKVELKQRILAHKPLARLPIALETTDRMTDAQVVARAREILGVPARRVARA
jgi:hypothetical protein